ncbi:nitroreductase family protein, putative [Trichophyton verrucosum HKI 0517]|uniref:Nitroreductase family protein, putative n=1 Tax=Trichophyton verrucosum (strain HKI 0517) TaxID=663202 RepID=D4DGX2_TRIVH|nr:nitroreductase family protein, putative [Trichophyton verrucosum HKI 0517]EFE38908.1 nitroreductase family protein, putative [Trichophyton verrucosum HKI 0517]
MAPSTETFIELAKARRSVYSISNASTVPDSQLEQLVHDAIKHVPSSFNTQTTRIVLLPHDENQRFWDTVQGVYMSMVERGTFPESKWKAGTKPKLDSMRAGYGTILFYEDPAVIPGMCEKFPQYKEQFPIWAHHSNAMHQYFLWTTLESLGLGASLQHYNPIIDAKVTEAFSLPSDWILVAQMPFGVPTAQPSEKSFDPIEPRVRVFGKQDN